MLSRSHAAPPCHAKRYTRFVGPPLAHTVSRQSRPVRARPSHAAGSGTRHTTRARTGSMRIRLFCPYPSLVTITDPSESVTRFKGSVPTGTTRPAGRIRQPLGRSVDPSGNEPGTRRVARSAAPAMAGSASRERLSMGRNMAARGSAGIPLALGAMTGLIFHLIPHTHWDREWYLPRAALQARLVAVTGDLIERLQAQPAYRSFLLDGHTVLVEDYLRACPDREGDVRTLVKTGRLQVGPWYVLPDEQIPSGEGLVRNLLLGAADAERLGGRLDVLYSPDAFGHPPAWPTLAREFGIRYGVVWRGLGGEAGQERDLYRWRGLDEKEVVLWHLPRAGYEIGAALPADAERLFAAWAPVARWTSGPRTGAQAANRRSASAGNAAPISYPARGRCHNTTSFSSSPRHRYRSRSCPASPPRPRQTTPYRIPNSRASVGQAGGCPNASGEYSTSRRPPNRSASAAPSSRLRTSPSPEGICSSGSTYHGPTCSRPVFTSVRTSPSRSGRTRR